MKIGLVLEGGGMRGLYTAGVLGDYRADTPKELCAQRSYCSAMPFGIPPLQGIAAHHCAAQRPIQRSYSANQTVGERR